MANLAIIPARGGSKRIPRKNIREFLGKPVMAYSIHAALESKLFDEVMVSTEDPEIAEAAVKYGAKVPFFRSEENANDFATTVDVLLEVLDEYAKQNTRFEYGCCLYPAAPFTRPDQLKKGFDLLKEKKADCVFPVVAFSHPVWRGFRTDGNGRAQFLFPEHADTRTQDLERVYHDAGQWYWFSTEALLAGNKLFTDKTYTIELPGTEVQDIDHETDWALAEMKYRLIHGKA